MRLCFSHVSLQFGCLEGGGTRTIALFPISKSRKRRKSEAEDRIRTRDILFTREALYQLSYFGAMYFIVA